MTKLFLPVMPASPMFIDDDRVMSIEWQEFFRSLFDRVCGTESPSIGESEEIITSEMYVTPINYAKRIDELEKQIQALSTSHSFGKEISDLEKSIVSELFNPSEEVAMDIHTLLGKFKIQKDLTFSNDTGTVNLFTVTGDVFVNIIPVIITDVSSAAGANIRLGVVGYTDAMIVDTLSTDMDAREIWNDGGITNEIENLDSIRKYIITDGNDIVLTLDAQVDSGAISFYCFWSALSGDGKVEVA